MHELKELSSFPWVCWRDLHAQLPCCLLGAGSTPAHHRLTWSGCSEGLGLSGVVPTSSVRILVDLCLKSHKRNILKEQMPSSGSLKGGSPFRNQSIPFYWKKQTKNMLSVVSVVLPALSAESKGTKQLNAFSSQESCVCIAMKFVSRRFS